MVMFIGPAVAGTNHWMPVAVVVCVARVYVTETTETAVLERSWNTAVVFGPRSSRKAVKSPLSLAKLRGAYLGCETPRNHIAIGPCSVSGWCSIHMRPYVIPRFETLRGAYQFQQLRCILDG
eukprot:SAG11_NODE_2348_length_3485_cov_1.358535_3_plen_122_part_00